MKLIFFSIVSALAFLSCNSAEKPQKHTLDFYVRYDAAASQVKAEAVLRNAATGQAVEAPGGIRYQGKAMRLRSAQGFTYLSEYAEAFTLLHTFDWKMDQEPQQFVLQIPPISAFGFASKELSRQAPATLQWEGAPLDKGETLVFMWENTAEGRTIPMELYSSGGEAKIEFPAAKIAELSAGAWSLYIVRKRLTKSDLRGMAVTGVMEYYTKPIVVSLK